MTPSLVIFDCDGVLVDSERLAAHLFAAAITEVGLPTTPQEAMDRYKGLSMTSCVALIEAELQLSLPDDWLDALQAKTFAAFKTELTAVPGVEEAIRCLQDAGIALCVASSGAPQKMDFTLGHTGLKEYFDGHLFSALDVARGKPHPDLFLYAAEKMGFDPVHCVVVEDSVPGVVGAVSAGMRVFGYAGDPLTDRDGLEQAGGRIFLEMKALPGMLGLS